MQVHCIHIPCIILYVVLGYSCVWRGMVVARRKERATKNCQQRGAEGQGYLGRNT